MSGYAVSVVIACHDARRWPAVQATLASVAAQTLRPSRTVIVVDHNDELLRLVRSAHSGADPAELAVLPNRLPRGASGSRNTGAAATDTPLVAFLDGDMVVPPHWLAALVAPLREPDVVGAGGATYPVWRQRPRWVPEEFLWAFGGSYPGMPSQTATVRNVWSASMVVRREVFDAVGGFHLGFGKVGTRSRPEDTHLCLEMTRIGPGRWVYVPAARAAHLLPASQSTLRYFLTRCYHEGRGKIAMARLGHQRLSTERQYLRQLPRCAAHRVADTLGGRDRYGAAKAVAIAAGVLAAGVGATVEVAARAT